MNCSTVLSLFFLIYSSIAFGQTAAHDESYTVQIHIMQHFPYCGGATPSAADLNRYSVYTENIVLIDLESGETQLIAANDQGIYQLNLPAGRYAIKEGYKNVPFHEFLANIGTILGPYIVHGDDACYKHWWESNLKEFTVENDAPVLVLNCGVGSSCYTGINPCDFYNGPIPN